MLLRINGKGMSVSAYTERIARKKAQKLECYFREDAEVTLLLSREKDRHIAEVTVPFYEGRLLRAEEVGDDAYSAIDGALRKLERQIRRHRTRLTKDLHDTLEMDENPIYEDEPLLDEGEPKLVKSKHFALKPMYLEEAELQMELLGHSFFVFLSAETGLVQVLYRRRDGDYGLLEPEYE